jgi:hypothetical protein
MGYSDLPLLSNCDAIYAFWMAVASENVKINLTECRQNNDCQTETVCIRIFYVWTCDSEQVVRSAFIYQGK